MVSQWDPLPSFEELDAYYKYDPETGIVTLKRMRCNSDAKRVGKPVGNLRKRNKRLVWTITHKYKDLYLSRVIWVLMTREDPGEFIVEYKNRNAQDNTWNNLRLATRPQNAVNQIFAGYSQRKDTGLYRVRVTLEGKRITVGNFKTEEEAKKAALNAKKLFYGEFACLDLECS